MHLLKIISHVAKLSSVCGNPSFAVFAYWNNHVSYFIAFHVTYWIDARVIDRVGPIMHRIYMEITEKFHSFFLWSSGTDEPDPWHFFDRTLCFYDRQSREDSDRGMHWIVCVDIVCSAPLINLAGVSLHNDGREVRTNVQNLEVLRIV